MSFIRKILPPEGGGKFFVVTGPKLKHQAIYSTYGEIEQHIERHKDNDLFIATAKYKGDNRTKENVIAKTVFYIDIDCGPGKEYEHQGKALLALTYIITKKKLPLPSFIVNSGGGLHVYWVLETPIPVERWSPIARRLVDVCEENGLKIDRGVTIDATRVLRIPGSKNCKDPNNKRNCDVLKDYECAYSAENFADFIKAPTKPQLKLVKSNKTSPLSANLYENRPAYVEGIVKECAVFKEMHETHGKGQSEELWKDCIDILYRCEDGKDWLHKLSDGHKSYDFVKTEKKYANRANAPEAPITCERFESQCSNLCGSCEHRNKSWVGSPLSLGRERKENPTDDLPSGFPEGYKFYDGGTYREDDNEPGIYHFVFREHITDFSIADDEDTGYVITADVTLPTNPTHKKRLVTTLKDLNSSNTDALTSALARAGISIVSKSTILEIKRFMVAWLEQLKQRREYTQIVRQYGWTHGDIPGFAVGPKVFLENGGELHSAIIDPEVSRIYQTQGTLEAWREPAQYILDQNRQAINVGIASAFAAPLLSLIGSMGVVLSLVSRESGTGKSTALKTAQGVWGNPRMGINILGDTILSVASRLELQNNLPGYWDELQMRKQVEEFVQLMFQLTHGKGKSRLSSKAVLQKTGSWQTMIVSASNESLGDHIDQLVQSTDAGRLRIFEIEVPQIKDKALASTLVYKFSALDKNFGHAGLIYAKWLSENREIVKKSLEQVMRMFDKILRTSTVERFWLATVATIFSGAALATKLGILKFDLHALQKYLVKQFRAQRAYKKVRLEQEDASSLLGEFLNEFRNQSIYTNTIHPPHIGGRPTPGSVLLKEEMSSKRFPLVYQLSEDGHLIIIKHYFRNWLYETKKVMPTGMINNLKNTFNFKEHRVVLGAGTGLVTTGRDRVIVSKLTKDHRETLGLP